MSKFKVGDYVVPLRTLRTDNIGGMKKRVGKVLQVFDAPRSSGDLTVFAGETEPKSQGWFWPSVDLRMATAEEIDAATQPKPPKPLKRGDLVTYKGCVCVVFSDRNAIGHFWVSALTGDSNYYYCSEEELARIGNIRKKVKRLRQQMEDEE